MLLGRFMLIWCVVFCEQSVYFDLYLLWDADWAIGVTPLYANAFLFFEVAIENKKRQK